MRYDKGHKETTRRHILEVASRLFRKQGAAATGLAGVMTEAGLTNGAFYIHFKSKDDLVRETVSTALDAQLVNLDVATGSIAGLEAAIRDYLSPRHRDNPGAGCPTSALIGEIARQPIKTRKTYTERLNGILDVLAKNLPERSADARRRDAATLFGMMVGILQLSRAVTDKRQSDLILEDGIEAALMIVNRG